MRSDQIEDLVDPVVLSMIQSLRLQEEVDCASSPFHLGLWLSCAAQWRSFHDHFLALHLDRRLPHMVLDSRANNGLFGASNLPTTFDRSQLASLGASALIELDNAVSAAASSNASSPCTVTTHCVLSAAQACLEVLGRPEANSIEQK